MGFPFHAGAALCVALLVVLLQISGEKKSVICCDQIGYLSVAAKLHDEGRFTDGTYQKEAVVTGNHGEGMFFAPIYPAFLALLMVVDKGFHETATCLVQHSSDVVSPCSVDVALPVFIQGILAGCSAFLVWLSAFLLAGQKRAAWIAMGLVLTTGVYASLARLMLTENLTFPLFTLTCLLGTAGFQKKQGSVLFAAGVALGLLALVRPSFPYLLYFIAGAAVLYALWVLATEKGDLSFPKLALFLAAGYVLTVSPWIIRNGVKLGSYAISKGYAPFVLSQRVAYNDMTAKEWGVSLFMPGGSTALAQKLFPRKDFERLDSSQPTAFLYRAIDPLRKKQILAAAGGVDRLLSYLVKTCILEHPIKHILVTLSLAWQGICCKWAWRGTWVCRYWGSVTIPVFVAVLVYAIKTRWWSFIIYSFPAWYMLGFNAFTTTNAVRYNLVMLPCLAISSSWAILWLCGRIKGNRPIAPEEPVVKCWE